MRKVMILVCLFLVVGFALPANAGDGRSPRNVNRYVIPIHPQGDTFYHPFVIGGIPYAHAGNTCTFTNDDDSYPACSEGPSTSPDAIFRYVPSANQQVTIRACDSNFDTKLAVYNSARSVVACTEHSCENLDGQMNGALLTDLSLVAGEAYYIVVDGDNNECGTYAFSIDLYDSQLPVELSSFEAIPGDGKVTARWATASETDNDYFELARDGTVMARVDAAGSSSSGRHYEWVDHGVLNGAEYHYTLYAVDIHGNREQLATDTATPRASALAEKYILYQNYPNPFNPETQISFDLAESGFVSVKVFNTLGREVATLLNRSLDAGTHAVTLRANDLPSGVYLYRLTVNGFSTQRKMVLLK